MPEQVDLAALKAAVAKLPKFDAIDFGGQFDLAPWNDAQAENMALVLNAAPALLAEVEQLRAEPTHAECEQSSALEAVGILFRALGWTSGGLASAAEEVVRQRDAALAELEAARQRRCETCKHQMKQYLREGDPICGRTSRTDGVHVVVTSVPCRVLGGGCWAWEARDV